MAGLVWGRGFLMISMARLSIRMVMADLALLTPRSNFSWTWLVSCSREISRGGAGMISRILLGSSRLNLDRPGLRGISASSVGCQKMEFLSWEKKRKMDGFARPVAPADAGAAFGGDPHEDGGVIGGFGDQRAAGPVGDIGGAGTGIHPVTGFPGFGVPKVGFWGVMDDDGGGLEFLEERVESIAQEGGGFFGVFDIGAEVSLQRVEAQQVRAVFFEERAEDFLEEFVTGERLVFDGDAIEAGEFFFFFAEFEVGLKAGDHFREVTVVVFGGDVENFEWASGFDIEGQAAEGPEDVLLDAGGGLADARGADEEHASLATEEAVAEEIFGGIGRGVAKFEEWFSPIEWLVAVAGSLMKVVPLGGGHAGSSLIALGSR